MVGIQGGSLCILEEWRLILTCSCRLLLPGDRMLSGPRRDRLRRQTVIAASHGSFAQDFANMLCAHARATRGSTQAHTHAHYLAHLPEFVCIDRSNSPACPLWRYKVEGIRYGALLEHV